VRGGESIHKWCAQATHPDFEKETKRINGDAFRKGGKYKQRLTPFLSVGLPT
jgi:hypothetical protein